MTNYSVFKDIIDDYITIEDITLNQFSERIDISSSSLYDWINLGRLPSINFIVKVADFFNLSVDYLLGLREDAHFLTSKTTATFIERINILRSKNGISKYKLAIKVNIGNSAVSKWDSGKYPKIETLIAIANCFSCSIDYLIGRED